MSTTRDGSGPSNRWGGLFHVTATGERHWFSRDVCFDCTATPEQIAAEKARPDHNLKPGYDVWFFGGHVTTTGFRHRGRHVDCHTCNPDVAK